MHQLEHTREEPTMAFWKRGIATGLAAVSLGVGLLGATPAQAAEDPSHNSGWVPLRNSAGDVIAKGYFDADANGKPGQERLVVQDTKGDGRGALAQVRLNGSSWDSGYGIRDPRYDAYRTYLDYPMWGEGYLVDVRVCSYKKGTETFCTEPHPAVS
jgi:hypothetical protein